MFSQKAMLAY